MRLSEVIAALAARGVLLPFQTHVDDSCTIADAGGNEVCVIDPNHQRDDSSVFEITTLLVELMNIASTPVGAEGCHKLDTPERVFFYEQDFYVLSNFSAFTIMWKGLRFDTSEAVYHWEKFNNPGLTPFETAVLDSIRCAPSAHVAFKIGQEHKRLRRPDWDDVKVDVMREILRAKADQHEYVRRKLLATGDRELIEDSWRDDFWGWGPNRDGMNALGKLWMEIRAEIRARSGTTIVAPASEGANLVPIAAKTAVACTIVDVLDMPENPTPAELGRWAATLHDLPDAFSMGMVRKIFNERRAARLREVSGEASNG